MTLLFWEQSPCTYQLGYPASCSTNIKGGLLCAKESRMNEMQFLSSRHSPSFRKERHIRVIAKLFVIRTQHRSWTPLCWFTFSKCLYHSISGCPWTHTIHWRTLRQMWMLKPRGEEEPFMHQTKLTSYPYLQPPAQVPFPLDNQEQPNKNMVARIGPNPKK